MPEEIEELRARWIHLYTDYLPALASAHDPIQPLWPVHLDHCFARIILDNAVGRGQPWTEAVQRPAVKHLTETQFRAVIQLAERIATGEADLSILNRRSLRLREERKRKSTDTLDSSHTLKKPKYTAGTISSYFMPPPDSPCATSGAEKDGVPPPAEHLASQHAALPSRDNPDMSVQLERISRSNLTSFRKQTLSLLCQIPRGHYSTYQTMAEHITKTSHKTCARAVGSAMRNNPFAPEVPCHRILAADGSLGGFCGHWGEQGKFASQKHALLHEEGVRFDSMGKVKGPPFRDFT